MKKILVISILFSLVILIVGCSFTSVSEDFYNPLDPDCLYFVGYDEAAAIYARTAQIGQPLALEEAADRFEVKAAISSGDTARQYKKIAYLLREKAKNMRESWDPR
ncbi:MAG: hypothetical protein PHW31_04710 [Candidatus Pacebacteria bacterium]|nr:hypothetical protein [Candidatus Paceibacterota bacterium]